MSDDTSRDDLVAAAVAIRERAYAPYSGYKVGAAIRAANGKIYTGVNVENAAYPEGVCAEAGAISAMIADGETKVTEVAVAANPGDTVTPCGGCRQKLREFAKPETKIYGCDPEGIREVFTLTGLLPHAFGPDHLE